MKTTGHRAPSRFAGRAKSTLEGGPRGRRRGRGRHGVGRRPGRLRLSRDGARRRARAASDPGCGGPRGSGRPELPVLAERQVRNVVLLIGDGMGLTQLAAGRILALGNRRSFPSRTLPDDRPVDDPRGRSAGHHVRRRGDGARDRGEGRERGHQHGPVGAAAVDAARSSPRRRLGDRPRDDDANHRRHASGFRGARRRAPGRGEDRRTIERGRSRSARRRRARLLSGSARRSQRPAAVAISWPRCVRVESRSSMTPPGSKPRRACPSRRSLPSSRSSPSRVRPRRRPWRERPSSSSRVRGGRFSCSSRTKRSTPPPTPTTARG